MPIAEDMGAKMTSFDATPETNEAELRRSWVSAQAFAVIQIAAKGAGFASVLLAVLAATPMEYGFFAAGVLAAGTVTVLGDFGTSSVVGRVAALGGRDGSFAAYLSTRIAVLYAAGIGALAAGLLLGAGASVVALVLALGLIMAGNSVTSAAMLGFARGAHSAASNLCFNVVALTGVGALLVFDHGSAPVAKLLLTNVAGATSAAIWSLAILRAERVLVPPTKKRYRWRSPDPALSWRSGIAQAVIFANTYVDQAVMYLFLGPTALAYYGLGGKFRDAANAIPAIVSSGFQAHFVVGIHGRRPEVFYRQTISRLVIICAVLGAVVAAAAPYSIEHWLPNSYAEAAPIVPIFAAGVFGGALHIVALFVVRGLAGPRLSGAATTVTYLVPALITTAATIAAAKLGGIVTVATVKSFADILGFAGVILYVSRRVRLPGANVVPLVLSAIPGVVAAGIRANWVLTTTAIALPAALAFSIYPREP